MKAADIAAVVVAAATVVLVLVLLALMRSLLRTLRRLTEAVDELQRETKTVGADARGLVSQARAELARVDQVIDRADAVGQTVDSASRLAYLAFSNPLIKVMAVGAGTAKAARALRGKR